MTFFALTESFLFLLLLLEEVVLVLVIPKSCTADQRTLCSVTGTPVLPCELSRSFCLPRCPNLRTKFAASSACTNKIRDT